MKPTALCSIAATILITATNVAAHDDAQPSRWLVTLEHLKPLSTEERAFVVKMLGIQIDMATLEQAIQEADVPLEAFGGE